MKLVSNLLFAMHVLLREKESNESNGMEKKCHRQIYSGNKPILKSISNANANISKIEQMFVWRGKN